MKHGMLTFARLVRAILGPSSIADRKLECGAALVILGMRVAPDAKGIIAILLPAFLL